MSEDDSSEIYIVFVVWKVLDKKWFPSVIGDNPSWPIKTSEAGSNRIGLQKPERDTTTALLAYRHHEFIVSGHENIETTYKMVFSNDIKQNLFKVNI